MQKRRQRKVTAVRALVTMLGLKLHASWKKWRDYVAARQRKHELKALSIAARREHLLEISFHTFKVLVLHNTQIQLNSLKQTYALPSFLTMKVSSF